MSYSYTISQYSDVGRELIYKIGESNAKLYFLFVHQRKHLWNLQVISARFATPGVGIKMMLA